MKNNLKGNFICCRKKKKKFKKSKKRRRRSESETTNTASETGGHESDADEWVEKELKKRSPEKNENVVPGLREPDERQAMRSNISAETSECTSQSNQLQKMSTFAIEGKFEKSCPINKVDTTTGMNVLQVDQKMHNNGRAAIVLGGSTMLSEGKLSELTEIASKIVWRGGDVERGVVEEIGERDGDEEEVGTRDKVTDEIRERMGNVNNENIMNISGANRRRRQSSRSRSRSHEMRKMLRRGEATQTILARTRKVEKIQMKVIQTVEKVERVKVENIEAVVLTTVVMKEGKKYVGKTFQEEEGRIFVIQAAIVVLGIVLEVEVIV